jgi:hypothetical protein
MSTTATTPAPAQGTVNYPVEATQRAAESGTFLHYVRRSSGPRRAMTPQVEAALRTRSGASAPKPGRGEGRGT